MRPVIGATRLRSSAAFGIFCVAVIGCGSGGNGTGTGGGTPTQPVSPGFSLSASPSSVALQQGASQSVQISMTAQGGFSGSVTVSIGALPAGIAVSPSSVTISSGSPATVNFSASATAPISEQSITFDGTSGTLSESSSVQVTVSGAPVPDPFHYVGGELVHGFYDESRSLLFATNIGLNELDVISGTDYSLKARIPVPQPIGIDQMADGNTLVIGTAAQELVTVDENTYATTIYPFSLIGVVSYSLFFPTVTAMANGNVLVIGQEAGVFSNDIVDGGQALFEWNPVAGTMTQIEPSSSDALAASWETDHLARSLDHKWAVFSADQFYLYSSDTGILTAIPLDVVNPPDNSFGVRGYAMNADGSKIVVVSAADASFFDGSFNLLGTAPIPYAFPNTRSAVRFSADGTRAYLQYPFPLTLEEVDAGSYTALGYLSATVNPDSDNLEGLLATDAEGHAYFNIDGGVRVVNLTQTPSPNPTTTFGGETCPALNAAEQLNTTGSVQVVQPVTGVSIYVGGQPAMIENGNTEIVIPASITPGPADEECIDAQGNAAVTAQSVSYGVDPVSLSANLLSPTGNAQAYLFGFGFSAQPSGTPPNVTIGNSPSPKVSTLQSPGMGVLQGEAIQIPSGTPGESVDVGVSSSLGSGTLAAAAVYYPTPTILSASGILQLTFDQQRNRLYALKATEVDLLDGAGLQWLAPLTFPANVTGTVETMGITPDATKLVVLTLAPDPPSQDQVEMIVFDLTGNAPATVSQSTVNSASSGSFAITNQNQALLSGGVLFDLSALTFSSVQATTSELMRASADGTQIYGLGGGIISIDPLTFAETTDNFDDLFDYTDLAVSPDGTQAAEVEGIPSVAGDIVGFYNASAQYLNANAYPEFSPPDDSVVVGATYSPAGKVLVVPLGDSIEFWDTTTGTLRARLMTPEELQVMVFPEGAYAPMMALNAAGDTIFAVSASGLSVIPLPGPIDQMAAQQWPEYRSGVSLSPALRGTLITRSKAMGGSKARRLALQPVKH